MKVAVLGLGYVGFTAACCIASEGHRVVGIDVSSRKVRQVMSGTTPIIEPQVEEMLKDALAAGRFEADTSIGGHLADCDLAVVCVGTPSAADGSHNMSYIADVTRQIAAALDAPRENPLVIAYRSTFRPGTVEELVLPILEATLGNDTANRVEVVYNPEFLREGTAVKDYFQPPKIVVGTKDGKANPVMEQLNANIEAPTFNVGYRESEITKFIDNSWHAAKVAFANEIGRTCLALGVSAQQVHEIFVSDTKLNISAYYMRPGGAFGGSCLPKDVRALQHIAADTGTNLPMINSLLGSNEAHKHRLFEYAAEGLEPGARILMAGLAFKAGTDDLRESPNVDLARKLLAAGFNLEIFDPGVDATKLVGANLGYAYSQLPVLERLLVEKGHAESTEYARVVATNATIKSLTLPEGVDVRNLGTLP
ncbi:nucleotide sugar dehydrogenase [Pseudoruegeria sp. HB172150]|uniref:nucleotide sugar dehydrogenase n=1 Tax=Pseudoruegeria sp. HB172150 TaxID=2721164 RepID=UPI0015563C95|nr:nucleotide sugar dehydrogenase [Pseudoruegeria sp. HB172150]